MPGKEDMSNEQTNMNTKLPLNKLMEDYVVELGHVHPEALIEKNEDIFIRKQAMFALVRGLFVTARRRGICFLN